MRGKLMAGLVLLLCSVALQAEQIYRWVDADGGVHYSSAPPPGQAAESEDLKFLRNPDPEKASERIKGYDETAEKRRAAEAQAAEAATKQRQDAALRRANCAAARDVLSRLENEPMVRFQREDGSYQRYTDQDRQQRIAEARASEHQFCD
ncbi:MAG: DUF4124 domain-containing protein [Gammaproteobacteria bacterium]|jgi:hypothetical protein|nr:DUF4124 domain-containing protein [Gammaproteobacteria bacterium]MBP6051110.1 DUF4124 domain-containing protein [Pseudomonadales bacterium]MBK6584214.1 DUF4124 domain-containing protein [Gammaproteobacteria bacterium]MBK7520398.1 DUF4124 domain-containing protein [Gammaproteobacteria bacterium]MBK7728114.1 DUF4124 domain-containing protein [Gammaproteobacteria bacterium]